MSSYIYLIKSVNYDKRYLGSTKNPNKRIASHNNGHTESTAKYRSWKCELIIKIDTIEEAREIEKYIKQQKEKLNTKNIIKAIYRYYFRK